MKQTKIKECRHGTFQYFTQDLFVGRSLDQLGEFSEAEYSLFKEIVEEGDVVVEVGANIGTHTVPLARLAGDSGAVIAIEPQRRVFQMLCANLSLNEIANVHTLHAGAGDAEGVASIPVLDFSCQHNVGGISVNREPTETEGSEYIKIITLDSLGLNKLDFLKIDVEGMEKSVLDGAKQVIQRFRPVMYIENDRKENSKALLQTIFDMNYNMWWHLTWLYNKNNFFNAPCPDHFNGILSSNLLCIPKELSVEIHNMSPVLSTDDTWRDKKVLGVY